MSDEELLVDQNEYLEVGIHIASKSKSQGMKKFIYKVREDGLYLLDLKTIDQRIRVAAKMIARYNPSEIAVTASRIYAIFAAEKFANTINAKFMKGRVNPGIFTNPNREDFFEPKLLIVSDTRNEKQAVKEASKINIPVIALCDTDNSIKYVDLVIPANNRGRRALAMVYYLLSREVLKARGTIKTNEEFPLKPVDFESSIEGNVQDSTA
ncbi:MAG: 30S ribosomal protein S2 [Candidatus Micrarchaeia archaeon]